MPYDKVEIKLITPQTLEELLRYRKEFEFLHHFMPFKLSKEDLWDILESDLPYNTLVYGNGILIGCFTMDVYKATVELHGICRPDIDQIVPGYRQVKCYVYHLLMKDIFLRLGKEKLIIKADPSNIGVKGFARMWGFKRLPNTDKGRIVWKLTKEDYINGQSKSKQG